MTDRKTKKRNKIKDVLFWILLGVFFAFVGLKLVDRMTEYTLPVMPVRSCVISSGSMSKKDKSNEERLKDYDDQLQIGDLVYFKGYDSFDSVKVNDVGVYWNGAALVTHRIVEKVERDGSYYVITQGDANASSDGLVPYSWVRGKVIGKVPWVGYVTLYIISPYGLTAICALILIFVVWDLLKIMREMKEERSTITFARQTRIPYSLEEKKK